MDLSTERIESHNQAMRAFLLAVRVAGLLVFCSVSAAIGKSKPNVIIVLTDDQGFGELGVTGNPVVRTPHIDRFANQCVSLTDFNVMPVCAPTRAGLMTGRDYYRTGLTDTWMGCALIDPAEVTVAEMLAGGGYRTGIFGKWHLGDNYPRRPMDKGFAESLVLNGGGLAQPGDPPDPVDERGAYFNATLSHNGTWGKTDGYVSDVLTDATIRFIEQNRAQPFFAYLAFNCPHAPHEVPESYRQHYPAAKFDPQNFPNPGHPMVAKQNGTDLGRVYGMIENIDDNVGRLLQTLDNLKLADDTIVILFSDNGCQDHKGFNAGFQGYKGSTFEGGIHQFCYLRWPAGLKAGRRVDRIAGQIDIAPTLLDLCEVAKPASVRFDGRSLAPLLRGENATWADRDLFFQWHRGDTPQRYRNCAVRSQDWKLVQPLGANEKWAGRTDFRLYDMAHDPLEMHDVATEHPDKLDELKRAYDAWFDGIMRGRDFKVPQRIDLGAAKENPVLLTRQDWRGPRANWGPNGVGYWELQIVGNSHYDVHLRFEPAAPNSIARLNCAGVAVEHAVESGAQETTFPNVELPEGPARLEATLSAGAAISGVQYVEVHRIN